MKISENAVELWCEEVSKHTNGRDLSSEEAFVLFGCITKEEDMESDNKLRELIESKQAGTLSVFWLRVKMAHTYEISVAAACFIDEVVIKGNFGKSTMMANYLQWVCHKEHLRRIGIKEICTLVFPVGVPTEEQWRTLWDEQKVDPEEMREKHLQVDNILDYPLCMESIKNL